MKKITVTTVQIEQSTVTDAIEALDAALHHVLWHSDECDAVFSLETAQFLHGVQSELRRVLDN